ncbi:MAG: KEOPS complex subunit Cgi121 [Candidatus Hodarchaeales archaeon]
MINNYIQKKTGNYNYLIFRGYSKLKLDISALSKELHLIKEKFSLMAIQFVDPTNVWNLVHVESAIWHAMNAFNKKRLISRTLSLEILLYLAGERQINKALKNFGLKDTSKEILGILIANNADNLKNALVYLTQAFSIEIYKRTFQDPRTKFTYFIDRIKDEGLNSRELNINAIEKYLLQKTALLSLE